MPKGFYKHKLILDENMPHRSDFPILNSKFDVKHIEDDFHKGGLPDPEVYQLAVDQKRILITFNSRHFRSRAGSKDVVGIIGVSANMPFSQVDTKLTALLIRSTLNGLRGKFTPLTGETEV